jgi:hypothetical protein
LSKVEGFFQGKSTTWRSGNLKKIKMRIADNLLLFIGIMHIIEIVKIDLIASSIGEKLNPVGGVKTGFDSCPTGCAGFDLRPGKGVEFRLPLPASERINTLRPKI